MSFFKSKRNLTTLFCILLISALIILTTVYLTCHNCFMDDDEHYAVINGLKYSDIFKSLLFKEHGGGYLGYFICKFMCFLVPLKLGIHPADWICSSCYNAIKGIFIALIALFVSKFIVVYHKSRLLFVLAFFFFSLWYLYAFLCNISSVFLFNYNFYRYFFSIIFFAYLIYFVFKNINTDTKTNKYETILVCFCAYVAGTSSEMLFISAFIMYILLIVVKFTVKNYKINNNAFIPLVFLLLAICLFTFSKGFQSVAMQRGFFETKFTADYLLDFSKYYFIIYFKERFIYWFMCILPAVLAFVFYKKSIKNLVFPLLFQISVLCAYFTLILCANDSPYQSHGCTYFIGHANLIFLFSIIMTIPLFIYISNILEQSVKDKKIIYVSVVALFICWNIFLMVSNITNPLLRSVQNNLKGDHETNYKADKLIRFQLLKGEKPSLPKAWIENRSTMWFNPSCWKDYTTYFAWVYGDKRLLNTEFPMDETDETLDRYYSEGGVFTEREMRELNFSRLKEDEFILKGN